MPYKRKAGYRRRKPAAKRARTTRRRIPRSIRPLQQTAMIQRTFYNQNWAFSSAVTTGFWRYFSPQLSQMPSFAEVTALFDVYKIKAVKFTFRPRFDQNPATGTTPQMFAHVLVDPLSNANPGGTYNSTNLNTYLENGNVRSRNCNRPFSVYWKPWVSEQEASGGSGNPISYKKTPWLSCNNGANVSQRGFFIFLADNNLSGTSNMQFDIFITYYMMVKGLK